MIIPLWGENPIKPFQVVPQPQKIEISSGLGLMYNELTYVSALDSVSMPVLGPILSTMIQTKPNDQNVKGVILEVASSNRMLPKEGYRLHINNEGVTIEASEEAGFFYGCQTLEQLLEDSHDLGIPIPAMSIEDHPAVEYRAVHFDVKNHLSRTEYYYRVLDKLARYKINAVIWEVEDKLRYTRRPEVGSPNALSKQEMQAISRYAKERHIEISPLVQGLGHAGFILKHHWELRENPNSDWEFCPSNPQTYEVQFDLYLDALEALPHGKYLHVGGDEISAIGIDERCKATGKTPFELQMGWLNRVSEFALEHGRTPIFWDDMPLKHGGLWETILSDISEEELTTTWDTSALDLAVELFPKECVYMRWNYGDATTPAHRKILEWYESKGLKVMGATAAALGASPFIPRQNSRVEYIKGFSDLVAKNNLAGILATSWDDGSPHWETVMRGFIAQGEYGWNPSGRDMKEFAEAHSLREFGFKPNSGFLDFLPKLEESAFFFDDALVQSGRRNPAWGTINFTLIDLPNKDLPGEWSDKYANKIDQAKKETERYALIQEEIKLALNYAKRNRYTLEIYQQTSHLFNYPVRLLLALNRFDTAESSIDREEALEKIKMVCSDFKTMRSELEKVYSQTRFMENPAGYIEEMNLHNHLAAKTNNSDWLYLYEIPFVKKVLKWLGND